MGEAKQPTTLKHLGLIMDGNRRWAKKNGLPPLEGHRRGYGRVNELIDNAIDFKIPYLTIWAFSTENWGREQKEVNYLMDLFREMFDKTSKKAQKKDVRIKIAGRLADFPEDIRAKAQKAIEDTKNNRSLTLNIAFSYGGHAEIVDATKRIISDGLPADEVTEKKFAEYIYEAGQPDIDMIVRTSGEFRHSGFMLWQSAYSEYYFIDKCWPEFDRAALADVVREYGERERRYGK